MQNLTQLRIYTPNYPSPAEPGRGAFVANLCEIFDELGIDLHIVAPQRLHKRFQSIGRTLSGYFEGSRVSRPVFLSLGSGFPFAAFRRKLRCISFQAAVNRSVHLLSGPPATTYAHFVSTGLACAKLPKGGLGALFVAVGESDLGSELRQYNSSDLQLLKERVCGYICVSQHLASQLSRAGLAQNTPILVAPNGVDRRIFRPKLSNSVRGKLGAAKGDRIVSFVGDFSERKGVDRVLEATSGIPDLRFILIGKGAVRSDSRILHQGEVTNKAIPSYLNASDLFVLPTLAEGCCNALLEAMACGLPIVTSDVPEVTKQFPHGGALHVNPHSIPEIRHAVVRVLTDPVLARSLITGALKSSECWDIRNRARTIIEWMSLITQDVSRRTSGMPLSKPSLSVS